MKFLIFGLLTFWSSQLLASPVGCEGAPTEAKIELPSPINKWALIFCSPSGHALAPIDGDIWLAPNGRPFMFQSAGSKQTSNSTNNHESYFVGLAHRELVGDAKNGTNLMLTKAGLKEDQSLSPWQLDIAGNNGLRYSIFFYEKDNELKHVLGCVNRCQQSVLLAPKSLAQLRKELGQ